MGTLLEEMSSGMHNLFLVGIIKAKKEKEKESSIHAPFVERFP
jgi:hypothetical protein